jgi:hypothetical protein
MALIALAVVHQAAALSRVALRASWLATALRIVDKALDLRQREPTIER